MKNLILVLFCTFLTACGAMSVEISKARPDAVGTPKSFDNLLPNKVIRADLSAPQIALIRNLVGVPVNSADHNETSGYIVDLTCDPAKGDVIIVSLLKLPGAPGAVKNSVDSVPCDPSGTAGHMIPISAGEFGEFSFKATQERSVGSEDISPYETSISMISSVPTPTFNSIAPDPSEPNGGVVISMSCKEGVKYAISSNLLFAAPSPAPALCTATNFIEWTVPPSSITLTDTATFDFTPLDKNDTPFDSRALSRVMPEVMSPPVLATAALSGPGFMDVTGQCLPGIPVELLVTEPGGGTKTTMRVNCPVNGVMTIQFPPGGYDPASTVQVMHYLDASGVKSQLSNSVSIN